ncbi:hypothetical protein HAX54_005611 [Datura stramonium]|uniref:Uncharacterized protein n=1 Tax=Datura stramonium TaxID=4076 RepID=A0ABS8T922_DATST|nr:hypothetical protein [Datura stramonium]
MLKMSDLPGTGPHGTSVGTCSSITLWRTGHDAQAGHGSLKLTYEVLSRQLSLENVALEGINEVKDKHLEQKGAQEGLWGRPAVQALEARRPQGQVRHPEALADNQRHGGRRSDHSAVGELRTP